MYHRFQQLPDWNVNFGVLHTLMWWRYQTSILTRNTILTVTWAIFAYWMYKIHFDANYWVETRRFYFKNLFFWSKFCRCVEVCKSNVSFGRKIPPKENSFSLFKKQVNIKTCNVPIFLSKMEGISVKHLSDCTMENNNNIMKCCHIISYLDISTRKGYCLLFLRSYTVSRIKFKYLILFELHWHFNCTWDSLGFLKNISNFCQYLLFPSDLQNFYIYCNYYLLTTRRVNPTIFKREFSLFF